MQQTFHPKVERRFLPFDLKVENWQSIEPYLNELLSREISSTKELENWLKDKSELEAFIEEDMAWRYIRMNIDTTSKELKEKFEFFVTEIQPHIQPIGDKLNRKLIDSPYVNDLDQEKYRIYLRDIRKAIELYREENIPLFTELQKEEQQFGSIVADMTVVVDDKELTLQQAAVYLKSLDREKRREVFEKTTARRLQDRERFNELFDRLIRIRGQVASNAGFKNYRDYKFEELGRFDYNVQDCYDFHNSVAAEVVPFLVKQDEERREALGLDDLRPWDMDVDITGKPPLKPFESGEEMLEKSIRCFSRVHPYFSSCLQTMKEMKHLDLDSRKGKAPGGFNYPLYECGVPFIFMNAAGTLRDFTTMVHEGGHAVHSFLSHPLEITGFKSTPSEVAELASMSTELISMEHWDELFDNPEDLKRAKREQITGTLQTLPWVASIDKFQHWIYLHPEHTHRERDEQWMAVRDLLGSPVVNWEGMDEIKESGWQKQLHLYEVPFYYIEYGFAQLGALAVWRNYKQNPEKALNDFMEALKLGYTKSIREIYETAGIRFDFSREYIRGLVEFVNTELEQYK